MSPAVVIVPVMLIIVVAAGMLVAVLAFPYRGKKVPPSLWRAESVDRFLETIADQAGVGRHPDAEVSGDVTAVSSRLSSSTAPRE